MEKLAADVFGRTFRHLQRYRDILSAAARHGFGDLIHALGAEHYIQLGLPGAADDAPRPRRLVALLAELGPTFIKAGQFLSTRSDLLAAEYLKELSALQDRVPPFPFEQAREIIEEELKTPLERGFRDFEKKPLAAASIAQIHGATLPSGRRVVVKVQRPDIRVVAEVDLDILEHLAGLMERHLEGWKWRKPTLVVAELRRTMDAEMDFSLEASHAERFAREFVRDRAVLVPAVHRELSSARVLTLDRIEGVKADALRELWEAGVDPRLAARRIIGQFLEQVFRHGFFHGDPHPGNFFIKPGPVVGYMDFGMMGRLDRQRREALVDLLLSIVNRDEAAVSEAALALAVVEAEPDRSEFERDMAAMMDQYAYRPVKELQIGRLLQQLFEITSRHRLRVPPDLFLLAKTVTGLESLIGRLDPDFDLVREAAPFLRRVELERRDPARAAGRALADGARTLRLLREMPAAVAALLKQARGGRLLLEFEHKGLEPLTSALDRVTNRLAFAVLLASLVIGSSLIVHARILAVGLAGFVLAALMAIWLLAAILRHGRM